MGGSATFIGSVPTNCPSGSVANFAGAYAPSQLDTLTQVNSKWNSEYCWRSLNILTSVTNASG
ncbi:MAG: hypothetical protein IPO02_10230 [Bacteroidetes bacterium]|nr:hypothetical protein [Bacteroidota bacterium]